MSIKRNMKKALESRGYLARAVDWVVEALSPAKAVNRAVARATMTSFTGASRTRNSMRTYSTGNVSPNQAIINDRDCLIERANDLDRNNDIAIGVRLKSNTSIIGTGLNLKSKIDPEKIGISQEEADALEKQIESIWNMWANSDYAQSEMKGNFHHLVSTAYNDKFCDGDVLFRRRYAPKRGIRKNAPLSTCYQLISGRRVSNRGYQSDTSTKVQGVNINADGVAISYDVLQGDPGEVRQWDKSYDWVTVNAYSKSGEVIARLLMDNERSGQCRGVPALSRTIEALKQMSDYTANVSASAVLQTMFTAFIETQQGTGLSTHNESLEDEVSNQKDDEVAMGAGSFVNLLPGEKVTLAQSAKNSSEFEAFLAVMMKKIGMSQNIPYQVLLNHFSSSYSSARAEIMEWWRNVKIQAQWLAYYMYQPAFESVIMEAHALGLINLEGILEDPIKKAAYLNAEWTGQAMPQIDPEKAIRASILKMESGISTGEREASADNGSDYNENLRVRGQERKEAEKNQVPLLATVGEETVTPTEGE